MNTSTARHFSNQLSKTFRTKDSFLCQIRKFHYWNYFNRSTCKLHELRKICDDRPQPNLVLLRFSSSNSEGIRTISNRPYDIVVFGASGFTGQYVAEEVARVAAEENVTWAVAGRNEAKLKNILENVKKATGKTLENVGVIKADVDDANSMGNMAKKAKIVLNCVGPFRFFGEAVVKACVDNGASHLDISGEPQFLERMQLDYNESARKNKVYVVGACGFDSIPADMGTVFLQDHFDGVVNTVEAYLNLQSSREPHGHYTSWESAIYGFAHADELETLRKKLFPTRLPKMQPKLKHRGILHKSPIMKTWCVPFPGSDRSVVMRSQRYFYEKEGKRPAQMIPYLQSPSLQTAILVIRVAAVFGFLVNFEFGRRVLKKHPEFFSAGFFNHAGPSKEDLESAKFILTLVGKGWSEKLAKPTDTPATPPEKELIVRVSGPEIGYVATPICMVQAAMVILRDVDKLPEKGGVYPPGAAFAKTSLIDRLNKRGVLFEVGSKK